MTICPKCERPIRTGQRARGEFIVDFVQAPDGMLHGVKIREEIWLEHAMCITSREGD